MTKVEPNPPKQGSFAHLQRFPPSPPTTRQPRAKRQSSGLRTRRQRPTALARIRPRVIMPTRNEARGGMKAQGRIHAPSASLTRTPNPRGSHAGPQPHYVHQQVSETGGRPAVCLQDFDDLVDYAERAGKKKKHTHMYDSPSSFLPNRLLIPAPLPFRLRSLLC